MLNILKTQLFITFISVFAISSILARSVPSILCPNYFQYLNEGNQIIGRIMVPNVGLGTTKLDVHLTQHSPIQNNNYGKVSLYESYNRTIARLMFHQPIYYRVTFPTPNEIPKLTLLALNGQVICQDHQYPPPSTNIALDHKLSATQNDLQQPAIETRFGNQVNSPKRSQQVSATPLAAGQATFFSRPTGNLVASPSKTSLQYQRPQAPAPTTSYSNCGVEGTSSTLTPFIYGGQELFRGQFPWLAAVYRKRAEGLAFICGGSLVSSRTVISAAHCYKELGLKANQVLVMLGHHDLNNFSEIGDVKIELQALHMHPDYNKNSRADADIAILHLRTPVSFSQYIQPICMWRESDDINLIAGHKASVAGWGEDEHQHTVSPVPKVVEGNVAADRDCQDALRSVGGATSHARSICVSNENSDGPCRGDSGGGLIMKRNGRWTLRGIVSSGLTRHNRCYLAEFVYFCDLAKHGSWLRSYII